jgi:hypothetical protein
MSALNLRRATCLPMQVSHCMASTWEFAEQPLGGIRKSARLSNFTPTASVRHIATSVQGIPGELLDHVLLVGSLALYGLPKYVVPQACRF